MKKPHNKAYLVIAGLALLAFVLTYALFSGVVAPKPVVVAKADMAAGTRLTASARTAYSAWSCRSEGSLYHFEGG